MLNLGQIRLPSERANAVVQTTVHVCVSEAISKSAGGDAYKQRLGKSGRLAETDKDDFERAASDPSMDCRAALTNFERYSETN